MRSVLSVVLAVVLCGWASAVPAQTQTDEAGVTMAPVVVTASREKEKSTSVPAHVTVIDAGDIENANAQNVPELLQYQGIHVSDIAGNKRSYSVDLRGFGESAPANTLVLVDGRRVNNPDLSNADWMLIPLERIERIEIIRSGRGSVLYGDNAGGGVINIITKEASGTSASATAAHGSYETYKGAASGSFVGDRWSLDLNAGYLDSDGYRENSGTQAQDYGLNLRLDPREKLRFHFTTGYHKDNTRLPGALFKNDLKHDRTDTDHPDDYADTEDYYVTAGMEADILSNDTFKLEATARERTFDTYATFQGLGSFEAKTEIDSLTLSPQFVFRGDFGVVKNRVIIGYDFSQTEEDIANLSEAFGMRDFFAFDKTSSAYYFHDELQVAEGVTLSGGYRNERAEYRFKPSTPDQTLMKQDVFTAAVNYAVAEGTHFYASYAQSYRLPLIDEMFSFAFNTIDTEFKPQESEHIEFGFTFQAIQHLHVLLNVFHIKTENEIFYNKATFENTNLDGDTIRRGFDVGVRWQGRRFGAGINYTLTAAEIDGGDFDGKTVPDVPQHRGSADISYAFDSGLRLGLNGRYVGSRYFISDFDNSMDEQADYFVLDAKATYNWRFLTFFVDLNNVLDREYEAYGVESGTQKAYYPSPRFNWLAGVKTTF